MPADKKSPIRAVDRKSSLRGDPLVGAKAALPVNSAYGRLLIGWHGPTFSLVQETNARSLMAVHYCVDFRFVSTSAVVEPGARSIC